MYFEIWHINQYKEWFIRVVNKFAVSVGSTVFKCPGTISCHAAKWTHFGTMYGMHGGFFNDDSCHSVVRTASNDNTCTFVFITAYLLMFARFLLREFCEAPWNCENIMLAYENWTPDLTLAKHCECQTYPNRKLKCSQTLMNLQYSYWHLTFWCGENCNHVSIGPRLRTHSSCAVFLYIHSNKQIS